MTQLFRRFRDHPRLLIAVAVAMLVGLAVIIPTTVLDGPSASTSAPAQAPARAQAPPTTERADVPRLPIAPGFPTPISTGIRRDVELTESRGFTASTDGATYSNLLVNGSIDVTGTNVTFNNVKVLGVRWYAIHVEAGASATFNYCDVGATESRVTGVYIEGTATLNACHVHDGDIDVFVGTRGHATINDSLLDDLWGSNEVGPGPSHNDALKLNGGGLATVNHSTLKGNWGPHGGNGGGISAAFHNSGGTCNVLNSYLTLEETPQSYVAYFVDGAAGSVASSVLEHLDARGMPDNVHALAVESSPAPEWSANTWGDGRTA